MSTEHFDKWWREIGSGIVKMETEDSEEHVLRVAKSFFEFALQAEASSMNMKIPNQLLEKIIQRLDEALKKTLRELHESMRKIGEE